MEHCEKFEISETSVNRGPEKIRPECFELLRVLGKGQEDPLEEMATHPSTLAWRIPWTEEPGRLQSKGSQAAGHD